MPKKLELGPPTEVGKQQCRSRLASEPLGDVGAASFQQVVHWTTPVFGWGAEGLVGRVGRVAGHLKATLVVGPKTWSRWVKLLAPRQSPTAVGGFPKCEAGSGVGGACLRFDYVFETRAKE